MNMEWLLATRPPSKLALGRVPASWADYSQRLSNGGERITLTGAFGEPIMAFAYDDAWHETTDGEGMSLEIIDLTAEATPNNWRPSTPTPGAATGATRPGLFVSQIGESQFQLTISGKPSKTYALESSPRLTNWTEQRRETTNTEGQASSTITLSQPPTFYRAREVAE